MCDLGVLFLNFFDMPPLPPPRKTNDPTPKSTDQIFVDIAIAVIALLVVASLLGSLFTSVSGGYFNVINWFYTRNWGLWYIIAAFIVGAFDAILLASAGMIIKRFNKLQRETLAGEQEIESHLISPEQEFNANWQGIRELMNSAHASDWNMAILRADAQLDDTLAHLGYDGETIADRLKIVDPTKLRSMDRVWSAHRLRNAIAHDPLQQYTREMMMHALESYEIAFKELGILHEAPEMPENIEESIPMQ